ncbi:MAG TPA: GNAT family N-acetyltransferase [Stellaceae bacterium]|nr:GNAT family N-acetyltransferase [Stellaceae bacterium]
MSEVTVAEERPDQPEAAELARQFDAYVVALYPPEYRSKVDASVLTAADTRLFVARRDGKALGCMALVRTGPDRGELKRCFVTEAARGQGVGLALLTAVEIAAREQKMRLIRLETGNRNIAALRLYRGNGFRERGPFAGYPDDGVSVFLEKTL